MKATGVPFGNLDAYDPESRALNVVIETPKGNRNKFKYDPKLGLFRINKVLPAGAVFPFDFGFVPATLGGDGDPLDVLVLMDEPAFTGCLAPSRLVGVIEAEEIKNGKRERNDRMVAAALASVDHADLTSLKDLSPNLLREIEHFFQSYNQIEGKEFRALGQFGPERAEKLIQDGMRAFGDRNQ